MVVCDGSLAIGAELHFVGSVPLPYHFASSANDEADTRVVYKIRERCHQFAELTFVFTIFTRMMFVQFAATIFLVPVAIQLVSAAPAIKTVQLHPFGQLGKCLDLQGNIRSGGQPIQVLAFRAFMSTTETNIFHPVMIAMVPLRKIGKSQMVPPW